MKINKQNPELCVQPSYLVFIVLLLPLFFCRICIYHAFIQIKLKKLSLVERCKHEITKVLQFISLWYPYPHLNHLDTRLCAWIFFAGKIIYGFGIWSDKVFLSCSSHEKNSSRKFRVKYLNTKKFQLADSNFR